MRHHLVPCLLERAVAAVVLATLTFAGVESTPAAAQSGGGKAVRLPSVSELPVNAKRWALVIGVDTYTDASITGLRGAANDARALADALVRYAGFPSDQVIVLATGEPDSRLPTRTNILTRLTNLAAVVPKDGLLLVSFSGHGMERDGQAFLLPSDATAANDAGLLADTAVSVTRIHDRIRSTGVGQVLVLLDACRNDPAGGRAESVNALSTSYTRGFDFDVANKEVQAFATLYATSVGARAYEYVEKQQGYFTWAVVEALKGGAADASGRVTLAGLVRYVEQAVPKRVGVDYGAGKEQKPFARIEGFRADDLVLAVTAKPPATQTSSPPTTGSNPYQPKRETESSPEVGRYFATADPRFIVTISKKTSRLILSVPGQPDYPLIQVQGYRYKLGEPAPDGFFITFQDLRDTSQALGAFLEQPQGNITLARVAELDQAALQQVEARYGGPFKDLLGHYMNETNTYSFDITIQGGEVVAIFPGQPIYRLVEVAKDHLRMRGLPDSFGLFVNRDYAGKVLTITLRQAEGDFLYRRLAR